MSNTKKFYGTSKFVGPVKVGKDGDGHDFTIYGATTLNYLLWDESANELDIYGAQEIQSTGKLQLRDADKYIYSSAASTLDIVNAGTSTKDINITGTMEMQTTDKLQFRAADLYIQSAAASTLDIVNARTTTKTINITGAPVFQGGNISASGARKVLFRDTLTYIYSPSGSNLTIENDSAAGTITLSGSVSLPGAVSVTAPMTFGTTTPVQLRGTDLSLYSSAASVLNLVAATTSGSIRLGGTTNFAQFKEDGEFTLAGNAQVRQEQWVPALIWDVTDTSACVSQLNSKYPVININPSAAAAHVYIYGISPVPTNAATACNPTAWLELSSRAVHAGSTQFRLYWDYVALGETTGTTGSLAVNAKYTATNARESASVAITDHFVQADEVLWTLQTTGSGESGSNVDFWGMRVSYVSDRLGNVIA